MARCRARMVIDAVNAPLLMRSTSADNLGYVEMLVEEGQLVSLVEADSIGSMLATLDDLLVNLKVADYILGNKGTIKGQED